VRQPLAQPCARETEIAFDRRHRDAERVGDFALLQTQQEQHFHNPAFARIDAFQFDQRRFNVEPVVSSGDGEIGSGAQAHSQRTAATLDERLRAAVDAGLITPPVPGVQRSSVRDLPPVAVAGKPASEMVIEDRR
jgi:hypothetical protein